MKNIKSTSSGSQEEMEEIRALYRKEAMQRKLLYNQVRGHNGNCCMMGKKFTVLWELLFDQEPRYMCKEKQLSNCMITIL